MDILRTMTVIQHPDGQVEMDRDMKGRWFKHSGENMSRSEWMHRFRPRCKLRRVYVIAADSGTGEHFSQQRHAASPKRKPCPYYKYLANSGMRHCGNPENVNW